MDSTPVTQLPPSELLQRYDKASVSLILAPMGNQEKEHAAWTPLHAEVLRRLELAWQEDASGQ